MFFNLRRNYQARVFPFTTNLPGPCFLIYDEITRPVFFELRRNYQARVFPFTTKLRRLTLNTENEIPKPQSDISSNIISYIILLLTLSFRKYYNREIQHLIHILHHSKSFSFSSLLHHSKSFSFSSLSLQSSSSLLSNSSSRASSVASSGISSY